MMSSLSIRLCVRTVSNTLSADAHTDAIAIVINPIATSLRPTSRNRYILEKDNEENQFLLCKLKQFMFPIYLFLSNIERLQTNRLFATL